MSTEYRSIDDYISQQPKKVGQVLGMLKKYILEAAPDAIQTFNYGIPAFTLIKGGKREAQIMMAGYKNHVGFYPHPSGMEEFAEALKVYKHGKGSVQFPIDQPLPKDLIIKMVKHRKALLLQNESNL